MVFLEVGEVVVLLVAVQVALKGRVLFLQVGRGLVIDIGEEFFRRRVLDEGSILQGLNSLVPVVFPQGGVLDRVHVTKTIVFEVEA